MKTNLSRRFRKAVSAIAILTLAMLTGGMSYEAIGRVCSFRPSATGRIVAGSRKSRAKKPGTSAEYRAAPIAPSRSLWPSCVAFPFRDGKSGIELGIQVGFQKLLFDVAGDLLLLQVALARRDQRLLVKSPG
jgi:hypothetical protein